MSADAIYQWLIDKPVRSDFRGRVAALIAAYINGGTYDKVTAWNYWLNKRPEFFCRDATPLVGAMWPSESAGESGQHFSSGRAGAAGDDAATNRNNRRSAQ